MTEVFIALSGIFLFWGAVEDYLFGTVGNYVWILGLSAFAVASWTTSSWTIWMGVIWFLGTGLLVALLTELGGADAWALSILGAGAWILDPFLALVLVAVSSTIYSVVMDKVLEREIRLIPSFFLAYLITFLISIL